MPLLDALGLLPPRSIVGDRPDPGDASIAAGDGVATAEAKSPSTATAGDATGPGPSAASGGATGSASTGAKAGTKPAPSPEKLAYAKELLEVTKLRTALGAHPQAGHVSDKTTQADAALASAAAEAAKPAWPAAMAQLATARRACEDGKTYADGFADYLVKRAAANLVLTAAQTTWPGWAGLNAYPPLIASAATKAAPATRNYAGAKADLDNVVNGIAPQFKKSYVDDVKPKIAALKALPGSAFAAAELAAIDNLMAQQQAGISGKQWRQVVLGSARLNDHLLAADKLIKRRADYDTVRPKANSAVATLAPHAAAVAAPLAAIQRRIAAADAMASKADRRFGDAKLEIEAIVAACADLLRLAEAAAAYSKERGALAVELSAQRTKPGAAQAKGELDVVRGLLDEAAKAAGDAGAPGTPLVLGADTARHDIATARARIAQARASFTTARALAESLGAAASATAGVSGSSSVSDLRRAADALDKEIGAASKAAHADLATQEFGAARAAVADARKQIDDKKPAEAAQSLATAGQQLAAGRRLQIEHAAFVDRHGVLARRLAQHNLDKAQADKIRARVDALAKALDDADKADKAGQHPQAMAALNTAEVAAGAADAALTARVAFDKDANLAQLDLNGPAYATIKAEQLSALAKARALADAFDFAGAGKAVKDVRRAMDAVEAEAMATKTPPDPKLAAQAKKMFDSGATKELDALIQKLPATIGTQVLVDLAQARFPGVTFEIEAGNQPQKSLQRMCELMKGVPDDVIGNPSLKKISRRVTKPDGSGNPMGPPYYQAKDDQVVMNSRPGNGNKADFPSAAGRLPEREERCKPANDTPEDMFDFNMLHELAHGIDDAKGFMASKEGDATYGGWVSIGADVDQIVDAVVAATGFGKSAEERAYVRDLILRNPATPPATFSGDKARAEVFVAAAQTDGVWSNQAVSVQATLGTRVYHEAYPNKWFSYLASARSQGITGYQFRAPGEWFSELYAAWKRGKLKPNHPAVTWLSKIKV